MAKYNRAAMLTMVLHGQQYGVGCNEIYWSTEEGVKLLDSEGRNSLGFLFLSGTAQPAFPN